MQLKARAITQATARFDLGTPLQVDPLQGGYLNNNYRLVTDRGIWMLKHRRTARLARVRFEHQMLRQLAERGVPVAAVRTPSYGEHFATSERRPLEIYDWVSGDHLDGTQLSLDQCGDLGHALASIHEQLSQIHPYIQQSFWAPSTPPRRTLQRITALLEIVHRRQKSDEFDEFALDYLHRLRGLLKQTSERRQPVHFAYLSLGYVHGDFNPNNVLFRDGKIVAILDWERTGVRPRSWELVRSIALWFADRTSGVIDLARAAVFVEAYADLHRLETREIEDMIYRLWWDKLNDLWVFDKHYLENDHSADHVIRESAKWVNWWGENRLDLAQTLMHVAH